MQTIQSVVLCALFAQPNPAPQDSAAAQRAELRQGMRARAEQTSVVVVSDEQQLAAKLVPAPLFRYSDQPRDIIDASFWAWQRRGRPVAFQKIEVYRRQGRLHWFYCLSSSSESRIAVEWEVGEKWSAKKPGIAFRSFPEGPAAARTKAGRLRQMRAMARRLTVTLRDEIADTQEDLRLLTQPIQRYGDPSDESFGGAVFGYASNGTNPDALALIQTRQAPSGPAWEYAWIQMTAGHLTGRLDGQTVWTAPYRVPNAAVPSKFDTWMFFRESAVKQAERND